MRINFLTYVESIAYICRSGARFGFRINAGICFSKSPRDIPRDSPYSELRLDSTPQLRGDLDRLER